MNNFLKKINSIRVRTFFAIFLVGIVPCLFITILSYNYIRNRLISSDVTDMATQAALISDEIVSNDYFSNTEQEAINMELSATGNVYSGRVMILDNTLKVVRDTYDMYEGRTMVWENVIKSAYGDTTSDYDEQNHTLTVTLPIAAEDEDLQGIVLITESAEYIETVLEYYRSFAILVNIIVVVVMTFLAFVISYVTARPFTNLKTSLDNLSKGFGDGTLNVDDVSETAEISSAFNQYNSQMKLLDDSRQEFVSNVSHELKTPLTSVKVLAESITSMGDGVPVEMYQEFMTDIVSEIDRETKIVNDLLSLVKMDKTDATMDVSPTNMNELIELIMRRLKPIAEKQEIELVLESFRPVTVELDEVKFSLAISNLIENGIKYNEAGGYVHVSLNADHKYCYIRVEDSGLGIPEDSLDHIFERFYRADKSHSREIGGTGLGLAITQNAIRMHHGEIKVASTLGEGTTFDVRVPLSYIKKEA